MIPPWRRLLIGGALGGRDPEKAREQLRLCEAGEVADLGADPRRRERVDAAKAAQARDQLRVGALGDELGDRAVERGAALRRGPRPRSGSRRRSPRWRDHRSGALPSQLAVVLGPVVARSRVAQAVPHEQLREPVARPHEVAAQVLAAAQQIAKALLGDRRDVGEAKLAGGEQPRQALGVAAVGLDAVAGRPRDQPGGRDADVEPTLGGGASQAEAGRPGLIDGDQPRSEPSRVARESPRAVPRFVVAAPRRSRGRGRTDGSGGRGRRGPRAA